MTEYIYVYTNVYNFFPEMLNQLQKKPKKKKRLEYAKFQICLEATYINTQEFPNDFDVATLTFLKKKIMKRTPAIPFLS